MDRLDLYTLFIIGSMVSTLMGVLSVLSGLKKRPDNTILWVGTTALFIALACLVGTIPSPSLWGAKAVSFANPLLFLSAGCLWCAARIFRGNRPRILYTLLGAILWLGLSFWPGFMDSVFLRMMIYACLISLYSGLACYELAKVWHHYKQAITAILIVLIFHSLFAIARAVPYSIHGTNALNTTDFKFALLEFLFFVCFTTYSFLSLVHERTSLHYRFSAHHDLLTRLCNRRALFKQGKRLLQDCAQDTRPVTVLMCDLDYFKSVNDQYGHATGDKVLEAFSRVLKTSIRADNICSRFGGEEFVIVMPNTPADAGFQVANRIRTHFTKAAQQNYGRLTVSIGVSSTQEHGYDLDTLINQADKRLYQAKSDGRDCVR